MIVGISLRRMTGSTLSSTRGPIRRASTDGHDAIGSISVSAGQIFAKVEDQELLGKLRAAVPEFTCTVWNGDDEQANIEVVAQTQGLHDVPSSHLPVVSRASLSPQEIRCKLLTWLPWPRAAPGLAQRPQGAGAQLLLVALLLRANLGREDINLIKPPYPTGPEIAHAVRAGHRIAASRPFPAGPADIAQVYHWLDVPRTCEGAWRVRHRIRK